MDTKDTGEFSFNENLGDFVANSIPKEMLKNMMDEALTDCIVGLGKNPSELVIQKSRPVLSLWKSDLTLPEFKILDTYLARIDSHNPDKKRVRISKRELEQILGVKKINIPELEERLKHLLQNVIEISKSPDGNGFKLITLFETAFCWKDESDQWWVDLECSQAAMKYLFNIDDIGYLRYKLRHVVSLSSRYSYFLFLYLEENRFRKSWIESVEQLRIILGCTKEECYKEFKVFNNRLLKRCYKELTEKTECDFRYETIKNGHNAIAIRFTMKGVINSENNTLNQDIDNENTIQNSPMSEYISFISGACIRYTDDNSCETECEFSREEMIQISKVLSCIPDCKLPKNGAANLGIEFQHYHYLAEKYAAMNRINASSPINNRYAYFLKMLKADAEMD